MRTFIQKQNQPQQKVLSNTTSSSALSHAKGHPAHLILHLQRTIGNQAVQRLLQGEPNGFEVGSGIGPRLQRADADAGTPSPPVVPSPLGTWDPDIALHLFLEDEPNTKNCRGFADPSLHVLYSKSCGSPIKPPFCQSARSRFKVTFIIDFGKTPRPQPFKPPTVSASFQFTPTAGPRGRLTHDVNVSDSAPRYAGPGKPLEPKFGQDFPFSTTESGKLAVGLKMDDVSSGMKVIYDDNIEYVIDPCV